LKTNEIIFLSGWFSPPKSGEFRLLSPFSSFLHDTTTKNVIVAGDGSFSGIVDVDDLCFGDPRQVKALTLAALLADGLLDGFVWNWLSQAGEEADARFWHYAGCSLLWLIGERRQAVNGNVSAPERMRRIEGGLEMALEGIR
jgi:hypothetical protein